MCPLPGGAFLVSFCLQHRPGGDEDNSEGRKEKALFDKHDEMVICDLQFKCWYLNP